MRRTPILLLTIALAALGGAALAGCGGSSGPHVPGGGDSGDVTVIAGWTNALRGGDVAKAASYFAIPSVVQNGTPPIQLASKQDVLGFNESLPCGAKLVKATTSGGVTTATFVLTDRPGGDCGPGVGGKAQTSFEIKNGKIAVWKRVPEAPVSPQTVPPVTTGPVV